MQVDGNIKGNVETTRDIEMSGKVVGDIKCNNANMNSAAMQGNLNLKGKVRMDRDTILIGDLSSQYADVNGKIGGKAELKRDAIVFGDINASTIAVTDGPSFRVMSTRPSFRRKTAAAYSPRLFPLTRQLKAKRDRCNHESTKGS